MILAKLYTAHIEYTYSNETLSVIKEINAQLNFGI